MKRVDERLPADIKIKVWIANHYKQILIFSMTISLMSLLISFFSINRAMKSIEKNHQIIQNLSNKVIFVRADGKVAILEKEPLSEQSLKYVLRDLVINKVIISASDIIENNIPKFENMDKIPKVQLLISNYFEQGSQGYRSYLAYLDTIWRLYKGDNLPEYIQTPSLSGMEERIVVQEGIFTYQALIPVQYVYAFAQAWRQATGTVEIKIQGKTDLAEGNPENPFGIKITNMEVRRYVQKKQE